MRRSGFRFGFLRRTDGRLRRSSWLLLFAALVLLPVAAHVGYGVAYLLYIAP